MRLKYLALGVIPAAFILPACVSHQTPVGAEAVIVRKMGNDTIWVKYVNSDMEQVISYKVKDDYYLNCNVGEAFDIKYALNEGTMEYSYSW